MFLILLSFVFCCCANANFFYAKNGKMIKWRANTKIPDIQRFINQKDGLNSELRKELTKESCKEQNKITNHIKWRANTKIPDIQRFINKKSSLNSELRKESTKESCKEQNRITKHKDTINLRIRKRAILNAYKIYSETQQSQSTTFECYYPDINKRYFSINMVDEYEIYGFMNPNDLHKFDAQILYSESALKKLLKNQNQ